MKLRLLLRTFFSVSIVSLASNALGQVNVTPGVISNSIDEQFATDGCLPTWTTLNAISITESINDDVPMGTTSTLILDAPVGWEFNPIMGTTGFTAGGDITSTGILITSNQVSVTVVTDGNPKKIDAFTISNIQVRPINTTSTNGNITASANGGIFNITIGSTNFGTLELISNPFLINNQPSGGQFCPGSTVDFVIDAGGTPTLTYQWKKNGVDLVDGGIISGSTTSALTMVAVAVGDQGDYTVVVTDGCGTNLTSSVASLIVSCSGPGGVTSSLELWVKANDGAMSSGGSTTDGQSVDGWEDKSSLGNDFTQASGAQQPIFRNSGFGFVNFNPTLEFDGVQDVSLGDVLDNSTLNLDDGATLYSVWLFQPQLTGGSWSRSILSGSDSFEGAATSDNGYALATGRGSDFSIIVNYPSAPHSPSWWIDGAALDANYHIGEGKNEGTSCYIYYDGVLKSSATRNAVVGSYVSGYEIGGHLNANAANANSRFYMGYIGEIIAFDNALTNIERRKVQSYLAIKYGITLTANPCIYDYYSANSIITWDQSLNIGYDNDIAGIARDNNSSLDQPKSHSINLGTYNGFNDIVTIANGTNFETPSSIVTDESFFVWGNNAGATINTGTLVMYPTDNGEIIETIFQRQWKGQETGIVNTVTLEFDLSTVIGPDDLAGTNLLSYVRLLVDEDGDYSVGATSIAPSAYDNTTGIVYFEHDFNPSTGNSMDQLNGFFFTLGSTNTHLAPLPVEMTEFKCSCTNGITEINWIINSEQNNDYFMIERSSDAQNWHPLGIVNGVGNSTEITYYSATDPSVLREMNHYRLSQFDMDGTSRVLGVKVVDGFSCYNSGLALDIFPNPTSNVFTILNKDIEGAPLQIYDITGRIVYNAFLDELLQVDTELWQSGFYFIHYKNMVYKEAVTH